MSPPTDRTRPTGSRAGQEIGRGTTASIPPRTAVPRLDPGVARRAALDLAKHGWRVLPLAGKLPAIPKSVGGSGVLDATSDRLCVDAWWSSVRYAASNIGARVPDHLVVLDVDPRHGGDSTIAALEAEHGLLPETLEVLSGRGDGGRHLYFRRPPGELTAARLPGIDLRTSNHYCVVPPSLHPETGEPYRWVRREVRSAPEWLVEVLRPAPRRPFPVPQRHAAGFDGLIRTVATAAEGNRNGRLYWAANRMVDEGATSLAELGVLVDAAVDAGLPLREAEATAMSALRRLGPAVTA